MPRIAYERKRFSAKSLQIIEQANHIIDQYQAQGFKLTLRQLYYQFVSLDWIANRQSEYKRLGSVVNDARMAGLIDWNAIEDRTRFLRALDSWDTVEDLVADAARWFHVDHWKNQKYRPEVWIEKDALVGVIEGVCQRFDVPYFSCRGYTSQSEMWTAAMRLLRHREGGYTPIILHFGDHDPSGMDMTRDIEDRLFTFIGTHVAGDYGGRITQQEFFDDSVCEVRRLALNWDQIQEYSPPPNPAKLTDSRAAGYIGRFGYESWELDALSPTQIATLIEEEIGSLIDWDVWEADMTEQETKRARLQAVSNRWDEVEELVAE